MARRLAEDDAALASDLGLSLGRLRRRLLAERDESDDLPIGAMAVIGAIHLYGELTLVELASHEYMKPPNMTRIIACLESADCVVRRPHESDGRTVLLALTDVGRGRFLADTRRRKAWLAQRLEDLSPQEREVLRHAAPILEALSHHG